jgi:hypothetical protein
MHRRLPWLAVTIWGLGIAALGMQASEAAPLSPSVLDVDGPVRPAVYLLAAGVVTCLVGLAGMLGWTRQRDDTDTPDQFGRLNH